ncbi:MAG TPA: galactose oxidase-like domain-containing protein [Actinomycetota bacterium]|nr:galactose oxidase-like domain-containing protein [Actinomycetota bacterium]
MARLRSQPKPILLSVSLALLVLATVAASPSSPTARASAANIGTFGQPFEEPGPNCTGSKATRVCKPAGVSVVYLPDGRVLYWDGLEATERIRIFFGTEFGDKAVNDQSRILSFQPSGPAWTTPDPADGGANPNGYDATYLWESPPAALKPVFNDPGPAPGAMFCSDQVLLANGDVMTIGGTDWYSEPHIPGTRLGVVEVEGLRNARIFHSASDTWTQTGDMHQGRWYPGLVTLANGDVFVASGVTKLIKPLYPDNPVGSGRNVLPTEIYHPAEGVWTQNPRSGNKSLPLYPRLHLLPDGKVYYDAAGQAFSPFGYAWDELTWNWAATFDPASKTWRRLGIPALGWRGSAFSIMLPLEPPYTKASFLSAGGVLGVTPGTYFATDTSRINTVDTAHADAFSSRLTGSLNQPRWYGSGVMLPTGEVLAVSGGTRDEVVAPGTESPVHQAELWNPDTERWTPVASEHHDRTYHNTAVLLPDGRVLVGGHAPLPLLYSHHQTLPGGFARNFRDPSFEIYSPPYLFRGPRPVIDLAPGTLGYGEQITIDTPNASAVERVALIRNTAVTHLVDGDQRAVVLQVTGRTSNRITVATPPTGAVAPPGPYLLFLVAPGDGGPVPSVARQVFVG